MGLLIWSIKALRYPPSDTSAEKVEGYIQQKRERESERVFGKGSARFFWSETMVSLQAALSAEEKEYSNLENSPPMKRKREDSEERDDDNSAKELKSSSAKDTTLDIELHLDTPLPLEWQRCLDIKVDRYIILSFHM